MTALNSVILEETAVNTFHLPNLMTVPFKNGGTHSDAKHKMDGIGYPLIATVLKVSNGSQLQRLKCKHVGNCFPFYTKMIFLFLTSPSQWLAKANRKRGLTQVKMIMS